MSPLDTDTVRIIEKPIAAEPDPIWPDAPRYCPAWPFPEYRYVRGLNPHPSGDKSGHSGEASETFTAITRTNWHLHSDFLFAIDLYHQSYMWESRRIWKGIAAATAEDCLETSLLQALIMNNAAQIRAHRRNLSSTQTYSQSARWHAARIRSVGHRGPDNRFMGFDIDDLLIQINRHYTPVWDQKDDQFVHLMGSPPRLCPELPKDD